MSVSNTTTVTDQSQSLITFVEKLEAAISFYQRWQSINAQRKRKKINITSVGVSKLLTKHNMKTVIANLEIIRSMMSCYLFSVNEDPTEVTLPEAPKKAFVKMLGDQLNKDHRAVLELLKEDSNVEEKQIRMKTAD